MRKMKIGISAGAIVMLAAAYFFGAYELIWLTVSAAFFHEAGHFMALWLSGGRAEGLMITADGFRIKYSGMQSYAKEVFILLAGPAASLLFSVIAAAAAERFASETLLRAAGLSLIYCAFNLLPVCPLDGGRALFAITAYKRGPYAAAHTLFVSGILVIAALFAASVFLILRFGINLNLPIATIALLLSFCKWLKYDTMTASSHCMD